MFERRSDAGTKFVSFFHEQLKKGGGGGELEKASRGSLNCISGFSFSRAEKLLTDHSVGRRSISSFSLSSPDRFLPKQSRALSIFDTFAKNVIDWSRRLLVGLDLLIERPLGRLRRESHHEGMVMECVCREEG